MVLELENARAMTLATRVISVASMPKPVRMLLAMSAVRAKSMLAAAAKSSIPGMVATIWCVLNPAIARYFWHIAASVAENFVVRPISRAFSVSFAMSSVFEREIAPTSAIACSKSAAALSG